MGSNLSQMWQVGFKNNQGSNGFCSKLQQNFRGLWELSQWILEALIMVVLVVFSVLVGLVS